ncbi:hypothetical protein [Nocardioides sp. SYSU DS0651]|uniref:hypothetical protein n=1 Tax=Nocardioides sp. SYSU DS0651 TaxID=3415955 RepID=UPI003F4B4E62
MSTPPRPSSAGGGPARRPSRRLPASVYWRRRIFVLGLAGALVFLTATWLTGGSDGRSTETPTAEQAGAEVPVTGAATGAATGDASAGRATAGPTAPSGQARGKRKRTARPTPTLAAPEGTCEAADVRVTPSVDESAVAGRDVAIALSLQTIAAEACTWKVAPDTITVRIARPSGALWTTQHCRKAVPTESVVVRRAVPTVVRLSWNARESAEGCRRATEWVLPGDYTIAAAALGGEPVETDFSLASPAPRTIEATPKGKRGKARKSR